MLVTILDLESGRISAIDLTGEPTDGFTYQGREYAIVELDYDKCSIMASDRYLPRIEALRSKIHFGEQP